MIFLIFWVDALLLLSVRRHLAGAPRIGLLGGCYWSAPLCRRLMDFACAFGPRAGHDHFRRDIFFVP